LVDRIIDAIELLGVDGIDLVQNEGYGTANLNANDESSIQVFEHPKQSHKDHFYSNVSHEQLLAF
jgi:hypothetical protein